MQLKRCSTPFGCGPHNNPTGTGVSPCCQLCPTGTGFSRTGLAAPADWQLLVDRGPGQLDPRPNRGYLSLRKCQPTLYKGSFKLMHPNAWSFSVKYVNELQNHWIHLHADFYAVRMIFSIMKNVMCGGWNVIRHERSEKWLTYTLHTTISIH